MTYLWNWYRTRRHISSGHRMAYGGERSLCGQVHRTRPETVDILNRLYPSAKVAKYLERMDALPVCMHCEREAAQP